MTSVDLGGLFGMDCFVTDKTSSLEQNLFSEVDVEFEKLLNESSSQNILDMSLQQNGITQSDGIENLPVSFKILQLQDQLLTDRCLDNVT